MVELRSCYSRFYFIQTVKDGMEVKVPNAFRGRPSMKFKSVEDLYKSEDTKRQGSSPIGVFPKVEVGDSDLGKTDSKCDCETVDFSDLFFGNITLKQIKETCKEKKRKHPSFVDLSTQNFTHCEENLNPQSQEDECDLMESLSCLKFRLSKKRNSKRKFKRKHVLTVVNSEMTFRDQEFQGADNTSPMSADNAYTECQNTMNIDFEEPEMLNDNESSFSFDKYGCYNVVVSSEEPEMSNDCVSVTSDVEIFTTEPLCCVYDEERYDYMRYADSCSSPNGMILESEIVMEHNSQVMPLLDYEDQSLSIPALHDPCKTIMPFFDNEEQMLTSTTREENSSVFSDDDNILSPKHEMAHPTEFSNGDVSHLADVNEDDLQPSMKADAICKPINNYRSSWSPNTHANQDGLFNSDKTCCSNTPEENQDLLSFSAKETGVCSNMCTDNASEVLIPAMIENVHDSVPHHPPENLLSSRKVISPKSQEKLCVSLRSCELDDLEYYRYMRKLCGRKKSEKKVVQVKGSVHTGREVLNEPVKRMQKEKNVNNFKSKMKASSRALSDISTGSLSIERFSKNAILFSQQQMSNFESVAATLTKELCSMRRIVETCHPVASPDSELNYKADQVKVAINNANRVEETTKKLLSAISRDCSRYCKIMELVDASSITCENPVQKRKKIVFADEAGGELCHVKYFNKDMTSSPLSNSEVQNAD